MQPSHGAPLGGPAKLALLGSLYFSQGLPFGFFTQALPVFLLREGLSLETVGLSGLLALAWGLKFLWAPIVDRHGSLRFGRRRSFIVPLQLAAVAVVGALSVFPPSRGLGPLLVGVLVTNFFAATQDIATDALAVDLLSERERGLGNGLQVAGYRVGMIVGGGAMLAVFDRVGWAATFLAMAALLVVATVPIVLHREASPTAAADASRPAAYADALRGLWRRPGAGAWLLLLALFKTGEALAAAMVRPWLDRRGFSLSDIGFLLGTLGFSAGLVGALVGGHAVSAWGRRRAILTFGLLQSLAVVGYALAALRPTYGAVLVAATVEHLASGMATAALFTAMMDACAEGSAATDYTVQASVVVLATGAGGAVSGFSARHLGFPAHFALAALVSLGAVAFAAVGWSRLDAFRRAASRATLA